MSNESHHLELLVETKAHLRHAMRSLGEFANQCDENHEYRDPEAHALYAAIQNLRSILTKAIEKRMSGQPVEVLREAWLQEMQETKVIVNPFSAQVWQWAGGPRTRFRFDLKPNFVYLDEAQLRAIMRQIDRYHETIDPIKETLCKKKADNHP